MSGGVDSSVAAALLLERGHDVTGVTLKLWGGESDSGCCSVSDVEDARRVAAQLGIPHYVFNFSDDFTANVVDPYVDAYASGRTPNPCVECNRAIKFGRLLDRAHALGFDAPGHRSSRACSSARAEASRSPVAPIAPKTSRTCSTCSVSESWPVRCFPVGELIEGRRASARGAPRSPHREQAREHGCLLREEGWPRPVSPGASTDAPR